MKDIWHIRLARAADYDTLVELWERSVRATHDFLTEDDIGALRPLVREALSDDALELWVLTERADVPVGFMGSPSMTSRRCSSSRRAGGGARGASSLHTPNSCAGAP